MPVSIHSDPARPVQCVDPRHLLQDCRDKDVPADLWLGKANLFRVPAGPGPGTGAVLLTLRDYAALDTAADLTLTFRDAGGTVALTRLTATAAACVYPGARGDPANVFLVELADRRWHLARVPCDRAYNVRAPDGATHLTPTTNAGTPWTWAGVVGDLWSLLGLGSAPALPFTPDGSPENLTYWGGFAWAAVNDVLDRVGCQCVYDPAADTFKVVRVGAADPAADATLARLDGRRTWDDYALAAARGWRPEKVRVLFQRFPVPRDGASPYYAVVTTLTATPADGVVGGTAETLYDDLAALGATGTPSNAAALVTRAAERAADWERRRRPDRANWHRVYRDTQPGGLGLLATVAGEVCHEDRGPLPRTEVGAPAGPGDWRPGRPVGYEAAGDGEGSGPCCSDGLPPGDAGECPDDPAVCVTWRTEHQHLENVAVRVGQSLRPGQLVGYTGRYFNGAHAHFGLGAGPVGITEHPTFTIGQTVDIAGWLGYPTVGTRSAGTHPALPVPFDAAQLAYIGSVFAPPLAGPGWKIGYGSAAHTDGEYFACDIVPTGVDFEGPPSQAMAGVPQYNAVRAGADVESVVEFVGELNARVHWLVVVRHRRRCCPADPPAGGAGSGSGVGSGSGGQTDPAPGGPGPDAVPPPANRVTVATGEMCFGVGAGSGSGPGAGLPAALSGAIADWVIAQVSHGSWDGSPFPLVARIARAALALPQGTTVEPAGCAGLSDECDSPCTDPDCDPTCRTDCPEAPAGAPSRWRFFTDATVAGGLTYLDIDLAVPCAWSGRWRTTLFDREAILYYDAGWTLACPPDGTGAVYDLGLDGTFDPLTGGSLVLANPGDPGVGEVFPDTILIWPACVPDCPDTPPVVTTCCPDGIPAVLRLTLVSGVETDCPGKNGSTVTLTYNSGASKWEGSSTTGGVSVTWRFYCVSGTSWQLDWDAVPPPGPCLALNSGVAFIASSCSPFSAESDDATELVDNCECFITAATVTVP